MLTEICLYLKNWFEDAKYIGYIRISSGTFYCNDQKIDIAEGQYFRVIGSILSDGVYKYGTDTLTDEGFKGAIWLMRVPADVIKLNAEIEAWMAKYNSLDSMAMSPFNSESFGGYSYNKYTGGGSGENSPSTWMNLFGSRLARYRKL